METRDRVAWRLTEPGGYEAWHLVLSDGRVLYLPVSRPNDQREVAFWAGFVLNEQEPGCDSGAFADIDWSALDSDSEKR